MYFLLLGGTLLLTVFAEEYVINNKDCKVPYFEPFSEDANATFVSLPYLKCSELDLLTYVTVENNVAYLHISEDNLNQYYLSIKEVDCCYRYVIRNGTENEPDVGISATPCWFFNSSVRLQEDIVMVKCYMGADLIYENVHSPIVVKTSSRDKPERGQSGSQKAISVLVVVIDSISRLNFIRTMPLTRQLLRSSGFIEYEGYSKIDDNTFPNFNALLTGFNHAQSHTICKPEQVGTLDRCPMIWYDFRRHGYVTAYAEDWASISTYNYLKKGFKDPPTDYYFKPYVEAAETLRLRFANGMPYCSGPETEGERILNLAKDFSGTFRGRPNFGIFWMNTFSHNHINSPSRMDEKFRDFFNNIKGGGILNESVVILLSDHGIRFGGFRSTIQGWYEERLPLNMISVPPWFQETYPDKYENLKKNSKRFTSTYDLYMTLQHILAMSSTNYTITNSRACPSCTSLFTAVSENRGCRDAGVPEVWCTCIGKFVKQINITDNIQRDASQLALRYLIENGKTSRLDVDIVKVSLDASTELAHKKNYMLMNFSTNENVTYQALLRTKRLNRDIVKVIRITRLY